MTKYFAKPIGYEPERPNRDWHKVSVLMWWEGRDKADYGDYDKLPKRFKSLVRRCIGSESKYLVYASAMLPSGEAYGYSRCMNIDNPNRKYGRDKAIGWLTKHLLDEEWLREHGIKDGKYEIVMVD